LRFVTLCRSHRRDRGGHRGRAGVRVALVRGFGARARGGWAPVDADTVFPIASLSKGFAAAAIGTLVAEGKLSWDDRVTELLPSFVLADPWVTRAVTLRDLLAHRVGWQPEVDYLPELGYAPGEQIARLRHATLPDGFRNAFTYTNVAYVVAAEAAAARTGTPWPALLRDRVLRPLALERTFATLAETRGVSNVASCHQDATGTLRVVATPDMDTAAPPALEAYAGTYSMPLLGDFTVTLESGRLRARLGRLGGALEPWRRDTFRIVWDDPANGTSLCVFPMGGAGRPARAELEDVGSFERRPPHSGT
jgi:CubicO group peptidase (beta-lactamase class C family)